MVRTVVPGGLLHPMEKGTSAMPAQNAAGGEAAGETGARRADKNQSGPPIVVFNRKSLGKEMFGVRPVRGHRRKTMSCLDKLGKKNPVLLAFKDKWTTLHT